MIDSDDSAGGLLCEALQPIYKVECFTRAQLVRPGFAQQGLDIGFVRRWLGAAAGGAEERQIVGEAREGAALLAFFEDGEHFLGALGHALWQAGQLGDMDTVGAVGSTGTDLVQKDDIALPLLDSHRVAGEGRELGSECR